ncbi:MAG: leucine-rich repeat protein [Oscillospiraceae bacterium]|nr:leucine-rich repeat protein [Oscillospiraceae bacterium]
MMKVRVMSAVTALMMSFSLIYVAALVGFPDISVSAIESDGNTLSGQAADVELSNTYNEAFTSKESLISALRDKLIERETTIELVYSSTESCDSQFVHEVFRQACAHDMSYPMGGDYLYLQSRDWSYSITQLDSNACYTYKIIYSVSFATTQEQEEYVDQRTTEILSSFGLESMSDYDKLKCIYNYICQNVAYDHDNLDDDTYALKHTPYAALHDGKAVCDGYAELLYIMLLKSGIDCRIITGEAGCFIEMFENHEYHAWNIVKIGEYYYNLDSTWDAGESYFNFFMLSDSTFNDSVSNGHRRESAFCTEEFYNNYPMSEKDDPYAEEISGDCGANGDNLTWSLKSGKLVISGEGDMLDFSEIIVPWYDYRNTITSLIVKSGVTSLSPYAFFNCTNLKTVDLTDTITTIGCSCFMNCQSLEEIYIPDSVNEIGDEVFWMCYNLSKVRLSPNTAVIPMRAFESCDSLTEINIPEGVTHIGDWAFSGDDLVASISLPSTLKSIGICAFEGCGFHSIYQQTELSEVYIPSGVEHIGGGAFSRSAISNIIVSDNPYYDFIDNVLYDVSRKTLVQYIDSSSINTFNVPEGVETIDDYAFSNSWYLDSINLPDSLSKIGEGSFTYFKNLKQINIPAGVSEIGSKAFEICLNLSEIRLPPEITTINERTFNGCRKLTSITIPESVTYIGSQALASTGIENITIPNNVTEIDWTAFDSCEQLSSVVIGKSVSCLDYSLFWSLKSLNSVSILNPDCIIPDTPAGGNHDCIPSGVTLYGIPGSTAQVYAEKYGREFVPMEDVQLSPKFEGHRLVLNGQIGVDFFVSIPTDFDLTTTYIQFEINNKEEQHSFAEAEQVTINEMDLYKFTCEVTSIEMADQIHATIVYGDNESVSEDYSVKTYISNSATMGYNETTMELIYSIANYGSYVQPFLAAVHNITSYDEMPVGYELSEDDVQKAKTALEAFAPVLGRNNSDVQRIGYQLNLQAQTTLNIMLLLPSDYTGIISAKLSDETALDIKKISENVYRASIENIPAHELGKNYTITITTDSGSYTVTVSALSYAYKEINNPTNAYSEKAMTALYRYYYATDMYRKSL